MIFVARNDSYQQTQTCKTSKNTLPLSFYPENILYNKTRRSNIGSISYRQFHDEQPSESVIALEFHKFQICSQFPAQKCDNPKRLYIFAQNNQPIYLYNSVSYPQIIQYFIKTECSNINTSYFSIYIVWYYLLNLYNRSFIKISPSS